MPTTTTRNHRSRKTPVEVGGIPLRNYRDHVLAFTHLDAEAQELQWGRGAIVDHLLRIEESRYGKGIVGRFARDVGRERRAVYYYLATYRAFGVPGKCNRMHFSSLTWSHFQRLVELGVPDEMSHDLLSWASRRQGRPASVRELEREATQRMRRRAEAVAPPPDWSNETWSLDQVYVGDIRDVKLPRDSVDMVFTDPPWSKDAVPLYGELARFAAHCLKRGGFCVTYAGKFFLPRILSLMSAHLEYRWLFASLQPQNEQRLFGVNVYETWRPLVLFQKAGEAQHKLLIPDASFGVKEKEEHEFQQQEATARRLIDAYAKPGGIVVDPFTGAGTSLVAAQALGRHFLGFDLDREAARSASARVERGGARLDRSAQRVG